MGARISLGAACAALLACGGPRAAIRPDPAPIDPPLGVDEVFAGAVPLDGAPDAPVLPEAHLRVLTGEPFRMVALRLDGDCRAVRAAPDARERVNPAPGDTIRIGAAPDSDYRVGPKVACPVPYDAPRWEPVLFYEAAGALRVLHFQPVRVGPDRGEEREASVEPVPAAASLP